MGTFENFGDVDEKFSNSKAGYRCGDVVRVNLRLFRLGISIFKAV